MDDIKDPSGAEAAPSTEEVVKNLKAEMQRKFENSQSELQKLQKSNEELTSLMRSLVNSTPAPRVEEDDINKIWFDNPAKAAAIIEKRAEERITKQLQAKEAVQTRQTQTINELVMQYPELNDPSSELYKKAIEMHSSMASDTSPNSYKAAVYQAALELDVKPVSKRKKAQTSEDFSFGGSSGRRSEGPTPDEVKAQLDFASLMGINDPKVLDRIKENTKKGKK